MTLQKGVEEFPQLGPADALGLDQYHEQPQLPLTPQEPIVAGKRGRKRKLPQPETAIPDINIARQGPHEDESTLLGGEPLHEA